MCVWGEGGKRGMPSLTSGWVSSPSLTCPDLSCTVPPGHRKQNHAGKRIKYVHGLVEESGLPPASVDALLFQYVIHECPQQTIRDFVAEGARVVKPGGLLTFVDASPK